MDRFVRCAFGRGPTAVILMLGVCCGADEDETEPPVDLPPVAPNAFEDLLFLHPPDESRSPSLHSDQPVPPLRTQVVQMRPRRSARLAVLDVDYRIARCRVVRVSTVSRVVR